MGEERLPGQAQRQDVGVELGIAFPGADVLELEHPGAEMRAQHPVLEPLGRRQAGLVDLIETTEIAGEGVRLGVDAVATEIF